MCVWMDELIYGRILSKKKTRFTPVELEIQYQRLKIRDYHVRNYFL